MFVVLKTATKTKKNKKINKIKVSEDTRACDRTAAASSNATMRKTLTHTRTHTEGGN